MHVVEVTVPKGRKSCSITPHHVVLSLSCFHLCRASGIFAVVLALRQSLLIIPSLTLSAFHLRMVIFSHSHFTSQHTFLLFFCLNFLLIEVEFLLVGLLSFSSPTDTIAAVCILCSLFYTFFSFLVLNYSCTLDKRKDLASCLPRLSGYLLWLGPLSSA